MWQRQRRIWPELTMDLMFSKWLKEGSLGGLSCSSLRSKVLDCFGPPDEEQDKGGGVSVVIYGGLQCWLEHGRVSAIGVYLTVSESFPASIRWADFWPRRSTPLTEVLAFVEKASIKVEVFRYDRHTMVKSEGDVWMEENDRGLVSIVQPCPNTRIGAKFMEMALAEF
jgi:hypothetical protein